MAQPINRNNPSPARREEMARQNQYSQYGDAMTQAGTASGNPYIAAAGIATSAYGDYAQGQESEKQYEKAMAAWRDEKDRQARMDEESRRQVFFQNMVGTGNYASQQQREAANPYFAYASGLGL
jgi:hypothetical protein